jgi:nucleotide-binding universal stress UspA family protein
MSEKALKYAIEIAVGLKMNISLVRAIEETLDPSTMSFWNNIERARVRREFEKLKAHRRAKEYKRLERLLSLVSSKGVKASSIVIEGDPAEKIVLTIKKENPYIVVIGSNRLKLKGLAKIKALGSVARKIAKESSAPVLVVR